MHRSRLAALIIDCQTADLGSAAKFWSQALGYSEQRSSDPADDNYVALETGPNDLHMELQSVEHPSRVHIDIETDNIEAEVNRLEKLGAKRIEKIRTWWVMEAPTGHRFCVVRPQRSDFPGGANQWKE
ncbi:MAG: VOC family protein [Gammaproteobacteria bacterium]|jgi:predicted enzyme related to lactoylglutathione lyase|nr:VOC family protein [Gammaproteobacteria bacterium]MDH3751797.1 VOC family protein [Gammaproteobacteria bacterium]MDH3806018.1 VOC family protein [Gammaproteobacteria bacterium]